MLLLNEYLCSCDVQEASRCLKEDPRFHHELGEGDGEYAQEAVCTIEEAFMMEDCSDKMLNVLALMWNYWNLSNYSCCK